MLDKQLYMYKDKPLDIFELIREIVNEEVQKITQEVKEIDNE